MKLLSVHFGHDSNLTYFDGQKVHYLKFERFYQKKHFDLKTKKDFKKIFKNVFNTSIEEMDDIIITVGLSKLYTKSQSEINYYRAEIGDSPELYEYLNPKTIVDHHYAHALCVQFLNEKEPDISFTIDGAGGKTPWAVFKKEKCILRGNVDIHNSVGGTFTWVAKHFVDAVHIDDVAGKFMGLQSYGKIDEEYLQYSRKFGIEDLQVDENLKKIIIQLEYKDLNENAPVGYFDTLNKLKYNFYSPHNYVRVTGKTKAEDKLNWGRTVHERYGEIILEHFMKYAQPDDVIHYSGGVAQNVIWNTKLKKHFKNLIIEPPCGDEGLSIGGMEFLRKYYNLPKMKLDNFPFSQCDETTEEPTQETIDTVAKFLSEGKIVAWYQGQGEIGPRALGNRSLLMDPRIPDGKDKMNRVKNREYYRPFGASVLAEYAKEYFDLDFENPYMLYVGVTQKDNLQAITHVDGTCRAQTVNGNSSFRKLLESFYKLTSCPVLLNTSLNVSGNPIAGHIQNAIDEFNGKEIDVLVVGNKITTKL